jgi:hypothetical protein
MAAVGGGNVATGAGFGIGAIACIAGDDGTDGTADTAEADAVAGAGCEVDFQNCHQCVVGTGGAAGAAEAVAFAGAGADFQNSHQCNLGAGGAAVGALFDPGAATLTFGAAGDCVAVTPPDFAGGPVSAFAGAGC